MLDHNGQEQMIHPDFEELITEIDEFGKNLNFDTSKNFEKGVIDTFKKELLTLKVTKYGLDNIAENVLSEFASDLIPLRWYDPEETPAVIFNIDGLAEYEETKDIIKALMFYKQKGVGLGEVALPFLTKEYSYVTNTSKGIQVDGKHPYGTGEVKGGGSIPATEGKLADSKITELNKQYWGGDKNMPGKKVESMERHFAYTKDWSPEQYKTAWKEYLFELYDLTDDDLIESFTEKWDGCRNKLDPNLTECTNQQSRIKKLQSLNLDYTKKKCTELAKNYVNQIESVGKFFHQTLGWKVIELYYRCKKIQSLILIDPSTWNVCIINDIGAISKLKDYIKVSVVLKKGGDTQSVADGYAVCTIPDVWKNATSESYLVFDKKI